MRKTPLITGFVFFSLILSLTSVLAYHGGYHYFSPSYSYSYPSYTSSYNPTLITDRVSSLDQGSSIYNRNFQGPIIQRDTKYDEFLKIGKSGRIYRTVSSQTSERYLGGTQIESFQSNDKRTYNKELSSIPTSAKDYDPYFRSLPSYDYSAYGQDKYGKPYYYQPIYNPDKGYYNWRY